MNDSQVNMNKRRAWDCPQTCSKKKIPQTIWLWPQVSQEEAHPDSKSFCGPKSCCTMAKNCATAQLWGSTKEHTRKKVVVTTRRLCYTCSNNSKEVWDDNQVSPTNHQGHEEEVKNDRTWTRVKPTNTNSRWLPHNCLWTHSSCLPMPWWKSN